MKKIEFIFLITSISTSAAHINEIETSKTEYDTSAGNQGPKEIVKTETTEQDALKMNSYLIRTMDALEKGVEYMWRNKDRINLDGVIGTRIVQGQLAALLATVDSRNMPTWLSQDQWCLQWRAAETSDLAEIAVSQTQPQYYKHIGGIISRGSWTLAWPWRHIDRSLVAPPLYGGESMRESQSDHCVAELLGSSGESSVPCNISRDCWELLTAPGYEGYSLTHQVFYLIIGRGVDCLSSAPSEATSEILLQHFCASVLEEAHRLTQHTLPDNRRDLFMEQQALCGMAGFQDFLRDDWLDMILSWQNPVGCWGAETDKVTTRSNGQETRRRKREERHLSKDCLSHRTAVALSALVQYARYLTTVIYGVEALANNQQLLDVRAGGLSSPSACG